MSEYRIVAQDELYHGRAHKYIKREWVNGQWRYFYKAINEGGRYGSDLGNRKVASDAYAKRAERTRSSIANKQGHILSINAMKKTYGSNERTEKDLKDWQYLQNVDKRNYAALMQQAQRVEKANQHNKKLTTKVATRLDRTKKWLSKAVTTKTSVSSAKSKKKGKSWLSKVLSTSKTTTHHSFGKTTTYKH